MDIQVEGFSPVLSVLVIVGLFLFSMAISWIGYSYLHSLSFSKRLFLVLLRTFSFAILFLLLLNPFIQIRETETRPPEIAVYIDDSRSLSASRGNYQGIETYTDILDRFDLQDDQQRSFKLYSFNGSVESMSDLRPELNGSVTNLEEVMRHLRDQSPSSTAALIFSDGIVTRGRDPLFTARELSIPVFTVPVGDTTRIRDALISDVLTDDTGYVQSEHIVDIRVRQNGLQGVSTSLQLTTDSGTVIDQEELQFENDNSVHTVQFAIPLDEPGYQHYTLDLLNGTEDQEAENDSYSFSVNVLDDKTDVLHIAFEIHPDVRAFRGLLASNESIELTTATWNNDRYIEGVDVDSILPESDLVVIHGFPHQGFNLNQLTDSNRAMLIVMTPMFSPSDISELPVPVSYTGAGQTTGVRLLLQDEVITSSLLTPEMAQQYETVRVPLLNVNEGDYMVRPPGMIPLSGRRDELQSDIPVLVTGTQGNRRFSIITAYGWYQLLQHNMPETRLFAETLLTNLFFWTATNPDRRLLQVDPTSLLFRESDDVQFRASVFDETGERESDAIIELIVTAEDGNQTTFTMQHLGDGRYELSVGRLPSGVYTYEVIARVAGELLESQDGEFSVEESTLEFLNTRRDDQLLIAIAQVTGGKVFPADGSVSISETMSEMEILTSVTREHAYFRYLFEYSIWFMAVLFTLTLEWVMRRRYTLP